MEDNLLRNMLAGAVDKLGVVEAFTGSAPEPMDNRLSLPRLIIITIAGLVGGFGLIMAITIISMAVQTHR